MSTASGRGAAYDATGHSVTNEDFQRQLDELAADPRVAAVDRQRMELQHQLYEQACREVGSSAHAAHVAQLRRLVTEAEAAVASAATAHRRAQEHEDGARVAHQEATSLLEQARAALAEVDQDGSAA